MSTHDSRSKTSSFIATRCKDDFSARCERILSDSMSEEGLLMVGHDVLESHLRASERNAFANLVVSSGQASPGSGFMKDVLACVQVPATKTCELTRSNCNERNCCNERPNGSVPSSWIETSSKAPARQSAKVNHVQFQFHGEVLDACSEDEWELPVLPIFVEGLSMSHEDSLIRKSIRSSADHYEKWAVGAAIETHMHEMRQEQLHLEELIQMRKFFGEQPSSTRPVSASGNGSKGPCREMAKSPSVGDSSWSTSSTISVRSGVVRPHKTRASKNRKNLKEHRPPSDVKGAHDSGRTDAGNLDRACAASVELAAVERETAKDRKAKPRKKSQGRPKTTPSNDLERPSKGQPARCQRLPNVA